VVPAIGKIPDSLRKCVGFRERKAGARGVTSRGRVAAWAQQEGFSGSRGPSPCGVPRTRIERIAREELGITADTALRLAKFFGTTAGFWINLQARYDIRTAERAIAADLAAIKTYKREAA
jgi:addiction module HigA family antidote